MLAVHDRRLPEDIRSSLVSYGFDPLPLPPFPALPPPVASHPDMLLFILGDTLLTHRNYYAIAKREIDRICETGKLGLLLSDEEIGDRYPSDILFNAAPVGKVIFARRDRVSRHIMKIAGGRGMNFIDIRQGYARCSLIPLGERAIITADRGIAAAARERGLDALTTRPGFVRLDGYDCGFIGGASGVSGGRVFFCGDLGTHPDAAAIRNFCAAHHHEPLSLSVGGLYDTGTLMFI